MKKKRVFFILIAVIIGIVVVYGGVHLVWRLLSEYSVRTKQEPKKLRVVRSVLWRDPGEISKLDFRYGSGGKIGQPRDPFYFMEQHNTGSSPSISVKDAKGQIWRVKWGEEVRSETFATRLAWSAGYFVDTTYFLPAGKIFNIPSSQAPLSDWIDQNGNFRDARFELDDQRIKKQFDEYSWAWNDNPFIGTRELSGLKIMVMLTSNWDTKDLRDSVRGSNTAVFFHKIGNNRMEARYMITDWGGSMGNWGSNVVTRTKWDPAGFMGQTANFITGLQNGVLQWGFVGQHTDDIADGIPIDHLRWLNQYLSQITDEQLEEGLKASGATREQTEIFRQAVRDRLNQLHRAVSGTAFR